MKAGSRIAVAAIGGYLVGRSRKLRWATLLGGAIWSGKMLAGSGGGLIGRTTEALSPVTDLKGFEDVRGRLVEAGKTAAVTAASRKIDAFSDNLHERAELLQADPSTSRSDGEPEQAPEEGTKPARRDSTPGTRARSGDKARSTSNSGKSGRSAGNNKRTSGGGDDETPSKKTTSGRSSRSRSSSHTSTGGKGASGRSQAAR